MADARVESIMDGVVTTLTNLTTTGSNIKRSRIYPWSESELPAISVYMGQDVPTEELQSGLLNWELNLAVESHVQENDDIDQLLNTIRKEVHFALMATPQQGLGYVITTWVVGANEPQTSDAGQQPIASQRLDFIIKYRTSRTALDA